MNEQLQKEIFDKVSIGIGALAEKLQVSGEFVFNAAIRWQVGSAITQLLLILFFAYVYYRIAKGFWPMVKASQEYDDIRFLYGMFIGTAGFGVIIALLTLQRVIPTLIAPDYAVIKGLLKLVK